MVAQHYRWDFVGLSTDTKPTPETSEKVVDGSTFYCSDTSKLYVFCKNDWYERKPLGGGGGGTTYTAGDGITIADDTISVDLAQTTGSSTTKVMSQKATTDFVNGLIKAGSAPTTSTEGTVGQLYEDTTNGKLYQCTAIVAGTDPDPDTYTWSEIGAGGGVTPVQTTGTSTTDVMSQDATTHMIYSSANPSTWAGGGAVYIGNLTTSQVQQPDPALTDKGYKYFWALPYNNTDKPGNNSVTILGSVSGDAVGGSIAIGGGGVNGATVYGNHGVAIGSDSQSGSSSVSLGLLANAGTTGSNVYSMTAIGANAQAKDASYTLDLGANTGNSYGVRGASSTNSVTIGKNALIYNIPNSVALGAYAEATRQGEVNIGLVQGETTGGFNNTAYRVIGGVHDGQDAHDAVTVGQVNSVIDAINTALSTNIPHIGASS